MKASIFLFLSFALFMIISCNEDGVELDKQVILDFGEYGGTGTRTSDTSWSVNNYPGSELIQFNKSNYSDVKTIVFAASISSSSGQNTCIVELFNLTDSVAIGGSRIETNEIASKYIYSENIIDALPEKTIDLTYRIKSSRMNVESKIGSKNYLILNR